MSKFIGKKAPDFSLPDQSGKIRSLAEYAGKYLLIYFYPKDMTSGCTVEAQNFRDSLNNFSKRNAQIIGVSCDSCQSHQKFVDKENLNFTLLADENKQMVEAYGVWKEKSMYGKKYMGVSRESFLLDQNGVVVKHYEKVDPKSHAQEVLEDLAELSA
jgi:peroxiredoxin Q/BCP